MMEWEPVYRVALLSFLIAMVFGAVVNKTNFCTMGAVSDWVNMGSKGRLRAWFLAIGIATLITQTLQFNGIIDLSEAVYLTPNFGWLGYLSGGFLFGPTSRSGYSGYADRKICTGSPPCAAGHRLGDEVNHPR